MSHAQFFWLHYTHCIGYGTLSECGHTTSGSSGMLMKKVCVCFAHVINLHFSPSSLMSHPSLSAPSPHTTTLNGSVFLQCVKPLFRRFLLAGTHWGDDSSRVMSHQSANPLWLCRFGGHGRGRGVVAWTSLDHAFI